MGRPRFLFPAKVLALADDGAEQEPTADAHPNGDVFFFLRKLDMNRLSLSGVPQP